MLQKRNILYDIVVYKRWHSPTCGVFCQTFWNKTVWWQIYLPQFHVSVNTKVLPPHSNGFLAVEIYRMQSEIMCEGRHIENLWKTKKVFLSVVSLFFMLLFTFRLSHSSAGDFCDTCIFLTLFMVFHYLFQ